MISFKDLIKQDNKNVFLNQEEFGETHNVDGKKMLVIIDNNEMLEREKRYKNLEEGLHVKQILFYVSAADFGPLPQVNRIMKFDGGTYRVSDAIREDGIYSISLEANRA